MFFDISEDHLVTTSEDKSVIVWKVESGEKIVQYNRKEAVLCGCFMPNAPEAIVSFCRGGKLAVTHMQDGKVFQTKSVTHDVTSLAADDTGNYIFGGTAAGCLTVFQCAPENTLNEVFTIELGSKDPISSIVFIPGSPDQEKPPRLLVNHMGKKITIADCDYSDGNFKCIGQTQTIATPKTRGAATMRLPMKSCLLPHGSGHIAIPAGDKQIMVLEMPKETGLQKVCEVAGGNAPVCVVAGNKQETMMASGALDGQIVIWRKVEM
jgi:WD40 repeat protein